MTQKKPQKGIAAAGISAGVKNTSVKLAAHQRPLAAPARQLRLTALPLKLRPPLPLKLSPAVLQCPPQRLPQHPIRAVIVLTTVLPGLGQSHDSESPKNQQDQPVLREIPAPIVFRNFPCVIDRYTRIYSWFIQL